MSRLPNVFATTLQKSALWLHEIEEETGWDEQRAYRALRGTLHTLRDRLTVDQAAHLGAQLPMMVRGFYYEGWHPAGVPHKEICNKETFLDCLRQEANDREMDAEKAVNAVFNVMSRHVTSGEMRKLHDQLPKGIARLLPNGHMPEPTMETKPQGSGADFVAGRDGIRPMQH